MKEIIVPKRSECVWDWFDTEMARAVPCTSLSSFYMYLTAPGTEFVRATGLHVNDGFVDLSVHGPVCDDFHETFEKDARLRADYRLRKADIHDQIIGFTEEQKRTLVEIMRKKGRDINMKLFYAALALHRVA